MINPYELRHLRCLKTIATNLTHGLRCKHAAMLTVGGKIVSIGVNKAKSDPLQKRYTRNESLSWTHAEVDCLKNVHTDFKRSTLYVVRTDSNGNFTESCPCSGCRSLIHKLKIPRIVHSTFDGNIIEILTNVVK